MDESGPRHPLASVAAVYSPERGGSALVRGRRSRAALSAARGLRVSVHLQIGGLHEPALEGFGEAYLEAVTRQLDSGLVGVLGDARG